jgi:hypothetical protein
VKTLRRYRTIQIQVGDRIVTAADPLPDDALHAITKIQTAAPSRWLGQKSGCSFEARSHDCARRTLLVAAPEPANGRVGLVTATQLPGTGGKAHWPPLGLPVPLVRSVGTAYLRLKDRFL